MSGARTEEPTPRRLERSRAEGDSGASAFASQALALVVAAALLPATVAAVASRVEERIREAIARAADPEVRPAFDASRAARDVLLLSLPVVASVTVVVVVASVLQSGGLAGRRGGARTRRMRPPLRLGAIFSWERTFAVARALTGGVIVAWVVAHALRVHAADVVRTSGRLGLAGGAAASLARKVTRDVAIAGLALAAVDVGVLRVLWRRRLRMSRDDVARERKEAEGDPIAKGARERAREEMRASGEIADVRRATVVVRDRMGAACALRYAEGDPAPVVLASGLGEAAERLVRGAREYGVDVEDAAVARALVDVDAGEAIPEALYDAVAEVVGRAMREDEA